MSNEALKNLQFILKIDKIGSLKKRTVHVGILLESTYACIVSNVRTKIFLIKIVKECRYYLTYLKTFSVSS